MDIEDRERLVRVETKLDMLIGRDDKTEERVRALEKKTWVVAGITIAISAFAAKLGFIVPGAH